MLASISITINISTTISIHITISILLTITSGISISITINITVTNTLITFITFIAFIACIACVTLLLFSALDDGSTFRASREKKIQKIIKNNRAGKVNVSNCWYLLGILRNS